MIIINRLGGFAANGVVTGVATLISIGLVLRLFGEPGWATFAVAQAGGLLLAVLVGFGWPVLGPSTVAQQSPAERRQEFTSSVYIRGVVFGAVAFIACLVLLPGFFPGSAEYLPVTIAYASTGLSSLWYYVGAGGAWASFFRDALPRAIASILAPAVAMLGPTQLLLGAVVLAGNLVSFVLTIFYVRGAAPADHETKPTPGRSLRATLARQWHGLLTGGVSSVYMTLPTIAVGLLAPSAVGRFSLGDKMVRLSSTALLPLTQVMQGWVPAAVTPAERTVRVRRALASMTFIGATIGALLAALGPLAAAVYSSGNITFDHSLSLPMGVILTCTMLSQVAGVGCLGAFNDFRAISTSAIIGAAVGLPLLLIATWSAGAVGAMWSVAVAEGCVLGFQLLKIRSHMRPPGRSQV